MEASRRYNFIVAILFGVVSIPWTYFFGVINLVLWPSFIASASFFAAGSRIKGLYRSYSNNLLGIIYAALTILIAETFYNGSLLWLSIYVGIFMFIASLHYLFKALSFMPATFFGYATMFSVNAADKTFIGAGLSGQVIAASLSMLIGALIGIGVDYSATMISESRIYGGER